MLRTPAKDSAAKAMQAAIDGGFNIVEFTLTTPGCLDLVADFRKKYDGKIMVSFHGVAYTRACTHTYFASGSDS